MSNNISNSIGLRIKQLREHFKLTQSEFSVKIGAKQANLSHIERKGDKISVDIISNIISNFSVDANWLLTGKGSMLRQPDAELGANKGARQPMPDDEGYKGKYFELLEENRALHNKYEALLEQEQKKGSAAIHGGAAGVKVG